jgi:hypothetical protein
MLRRIRKSTLVARTPSHYMVSVMGTSSFGTIKLSRL